MFVVATAPPPSARTFRLTIVAFPRKSLANQQHRQSFDVDVLGSNQPPSNVNASPLIAPSSPIVPLETRTTAVGPRMTRYVYASTIAGSSSRTQPTINTHTRVSTSKRSAERRCSTSNQHDPSRSYVKRPWWLWLVFKAAVLLTQDAVATAAPARDCAPFPASSPFLPSASSRQQGRVHHPVDCDPAICVETTGAYAGIAVGRVPLQ